jgi:tRNA pseudouridine38-40 synthase
MSFKGTRYHGFQRQENAVAVQNAVEDKLSRLLASKVVINGCSRTDSGVHALEYCFNFETANPIPCENLLYAANRVLPDDIAFSRCEEAPPGFHARYDCVAKEYVYLICDAPVKDPFYADSCLFYHKRLDIDLLRRAAGDIAGTRDFTSFCGAAGLKERGSRVRTVEYCKVERGSDLTGSQNENFVKILVKGDGFLYNMVRVIAGTLLFVGDGKIDADALPHIISVRDRAAAGKTAPARGLYLNKVFY